MSSGQATSIINNIDYYLVWILLPWSVTCSASGFPRKSGKANNGRCCSVCQIYFSSFYLKALVLISFSRRTPINTCIQATDTVHHRSPKDTRFDREFNFVFGTRTYGWYDRSCTDLRTPCQRIDIVASCLVLPCQLFTINDCLAQREHLQFWFTKFENVERFLIRLLCKI